MAINPPYADLETLAMVIARSQIVVADPALRRRLPQRLPSGFDEVDVAVLDWIAAEGRRADRRYLPV
jgi:hypothetical protein